MKIVIDIPEEEYRIICKDPSTIIGKAIKNGTSPHKEGKWLDKKITIKKAHGIAYGRWGCSVCKIKQPHKSNFCPNCGADMREEGSKQG